MTFRAPSVIRSLEDAAVVFRDHEDINIDKIRTWSRQFGEAQQDLALKILNNVNYYPGTSIRAMVHCLISGICTRLRLNKGRDIFYIPVGDQYSGSSVVLRVLRDVPGIHTNQIKYLREMANIPSNPSVKAIVLLEDFSGTGQQLKDWWRNVETLLLPWTEKSVKLILGILVLNHKANGVLNSIPMPRFHSEYLNEEFNVFSVRSRIFSGAEKAQIETFCRRTGCASQYIRGRGNCGLLVAFRHACPNNSLPVLWHSSNRWNNLFKRRAV